MAAVALALSGFSQDKAPADEAAWRACQGSAPADFTSGYSARGDAGPQLDVYLPRTEALPANRRPPVLLLVHGGGWTGGSREALAPQARYFASLGWVCVNADYRLAGAAGATLQEAQDDVRAAWAWIRAESGRRNWDAGRIVVLGESAGGQLACALGVLPPEPERWRARALVLVNPVLDLTTLDWTKSLPGLREAGPYNAAAPGSHPAWRWSPCFHLTAAAPPMLLLQGRKDVTVPVDQAERFAAKAREVGARVELVVLDEAAHAFLLADYSSAEVIRASLRRIAVFLEKQ